MIADLKPYSNYRESGLPWLGKVQEHWKQRRTKFLFRERVQKGFPDEPLLAATQSKGVVRKDEYGSRTVTATKDLHLLKLVEQGDYVISLRSFEGGIEVAHSRGIISPAYTVLAPKKEASHGYYTHFFKSPDFIRSLTLFVTGIREGQNIDYERLSRAYFPLPPPDEQVAIVRFLGWANGQLEKAIRAKRKVITLLNEQKLVIIHRAVTRGLDPSVPLKPSGISWIGDIPEHWKVRRLKSFAHFQSGDGITSLQIEPIGKFPVYGGNGLRGYTSKYTHDGHYALIGRQGALCGNINFAMGKFFASEHAVVPTLKVGMNVVWFGNLLRIMNLNQYSQSAAQPGLAVERIKNLYAPIPPSNEQIAIVNGINSESSPITTATSRFEREIELLREYRIRLVADVVTGKLDVREAAAKLPDEVQALEFEDDLIALEEDADSSL